MDYLQSKYISPYKGNEKRNLYNNSTIIDEIWSKQISFHDRTSLGYKEDEEVDKGTPMSKFEEGSSSSKRQRVITNQIQDQNSTMRMNYGRQRLKHEAYKKGSLSYHTNTWYDNIFNGLCYSCHKHGHKAVECDAFEKKT